MHSIRLIATQYQKESKILVAPPSRHSSVLVEHLREVLTLWASGMIGPGFKSRPGAYLQGSMEENSLAVMVATKSGQQVGGPEVESSGPTCNMGNASIKHRIRLPILALKLVRRCHQKPQNTGISDR